MDLKKEYLENVKIDGKPAVLDFVINEIDAVTGETVITRRYVTADLKKRVLKVERLPAAVKPVPAAAPVAPAAPVTKTVTPKPVTFPRPVSVKSKTGALKVKDLASGQTVVYYTKEGREAGVVVKVTLRTFCVDVDGVKDKQIKKSDLIGLYLGD